MIFAPSPVNAQTLDEYVQHAIYERQAGNYENAAIILRHVLIQDPDNIEARRLYAGTLFKLGFYEDSEYQLLTLIETDSNWEQQKEYHFALDQLIKADPFQFNGWMAVQPSSNVNGGSAETIFDTNLGQFVIDDASREKSGIGISAGGTAQYRISLGAGTILAGRFDTSYNWYKIKELRSLPLTASLEITHYGLFGKYSAQPYIQYVWAGENDDGERSNRKAAGLILSGSKRMNAKYRLNANARYEYRDFIDKDYLDGPYAQSALSVTYAPSPSVQFTAGLGIERSLSYDARHLSYTGYSASFSGVKAWKGGFVTGAGLSLGSNTYDEEFPTVDKTREDDKLDAFISVKHNRINLFSATPEITCRYQKTDSNISLYQNDSYGCFIALTRRLSL